MASPAGQVTPVWIQQEIVNQQVTGHDERWIEARLGEKLYDMEQFRLARDPVPGREHFNRRDSMAPIEWWWYH